MTIGWVAEIENRKQVLDRELALLESSDGTAARKTQARAAVTALGTVVYRDEKLSRVLPHPRAREAAWEAVHDAEEAVNAATQDAAELVARAEDHARRDLRREDAAARLKLMNEQPDDASKVRAARAIIRDSHEEADKYLANLRAQNQSNLLLAATVLAGLVVLAWTGIGALVLPALSLPAGTPMQGQDLFWVILGFGALGGVLSALFTVVSQPGYDDARYYDPRPGLIALKVVCGALFGLLGILLVAGGSVVATFSSVTAVAVVAVVFGYSQQSVTRLLDRRAREYVEGASARPSSKTPTADA